MFTISNIIIVQLKKYNSIFIGSDFYRQESTMNKVKLFTMLMLFVIIIAFATNGAESRSTCIPE